MTQSERCFSPFLCGGVVVSEWSYWIIDLFNDGDRKKPICERNKDKGYYFSNLLFFLIYIELNIFFLLFITRKINFYILDL